MPWMVLFVGLALWALSPLVGSAAAALRVAAGIMFVTGAVLAAVGMG